MTTAVTSRGTTSELRLHHDTAAVSPSSSPSKAASDTLQRTESASSSATVHPLRNDNEPKSASSTSSSPTLQSAASSSMHNNTISTVASSMRTADSHTSFAGADGDASHKTSSRPPAPHSIQTTFDDERRNECHDEKHAYGAHTRDGAERWDEGHYRDEEEEDVYSTHDEEAPIQYPPISEEDREARKVEQKLEQWAAEEKLRRKAKRSSRTTSTLVPPASASRLSKRLSALGSLSKTPEHPSGAVMQSYENGVEARSNDVYGKQGAVLSTDALMENGRTSRNTRWLQRDESSQNIHESGNGDANISFDSYGTSTPLSTDKGKGKQREASDPFRDPVVARSMKPTPRHPIVTPGRAPTIRHRALEQAHTYYQDTTLHAGSQQRAPAIVATDTDEEREAQSALDRFQRLEDDPFQSASERRAAAAVALDSSMTPKRREMVKGNSTYTIGSTIDEAPDRPELPKRKSTSSRFNEIGLDDGQDASGWPIDDGGASSPGDVTPRPKHLTLRNEDATHGRRDDVSVPRAPWYTEWLCGCGTPDDPDLEQSGRTFPE